MPTLFVTCSQCGNDFPTPIATDSAHTEGVLISGLSLCCVECQATDLYFTKDFHAAREVPQEPTPVTKEARAEPSSSKGYPSGRATWTSWFTSSR